MKASTLARVGLLHAAAAEYIWPSKFDLMEDLLYLQSGYVRQGFMDGVVPCSRDPGDPSRQTAAEWVRTSFHDMATYDAATGVGGLDASIQFETDRAENAGDAFNETLLSAVNYFTARSSAADLIALSTVVAVGACGGPKVPFRAGRVDATEGGVLGVPEPQQDLDTHKRMFAKAGFSTEDMIAMVACGHTLGGVHGKTFPQITDDNSNSSIVHFDSTTNDFDTTVVTEYLDGSTSNPLVVASNDTFNSDKRIFAADGNKTMNALAEAATFKTMCADIFARMIDTVPTSVKLSEPLEPSPLKPYIKSFSLVNATHMTLSGRIRLLTDAERYDDETVTLHYTPRNAVHINGTVNTTIETTRASFLLGLSSGLFGETFKWHEFSTTIPTASSIESFTATVTRDSTGAKTVYDNGGNGFPLDDRVLFQDAQSCVIDGTTKIVAAVRKEIVEAGTPIVSEMAPMIERQGTVVPMLRYETWQGEVSKAVGDWVLVTMSKASSNIGNHFDIVAGKAKLKFLETTIIEQGQCIQL